jgi:iron complex outermembrane receptor protein
MVADLVVSGPWFDLASTGRTVNLAYGAQFRNERYSVNRNDIYTQRPDPQTGQLQDVDLIFLGGGAPVDVERDSFAAFAEASVELSDAVEVNVAARYESLETDSSFDPKLSLRWQVTDDVVLRASMSTAFREPSLIQQYNVGTSLQQIRDPLSPGGSLFIRVRAEGRNDLVAETSTNTNLGLLWSPSENLDFRVDYWSFEYEDVITVENAQAKINADPLGDFASRVDGILNGILVEYLNAEEVNTDGIDIAADWSVSLDDIGDIGLQFSMSRFISYEIPDGSGGLTDVVGSFNYDNFVRSLPETKWNFTADWERGNHSAAMVVYSVDSYKTNRPLSAYAENLGFNNHINTWRTVDLSYNYNFELGDTQAVFTIGGKNILDREAPMVWDDTNFSYDPKQHDPRGRMYFARVKFAL